MPRDVGQVDQDVCIGWQWANWKCGHELCAGCTGCAGRAGCQVLSTPAVRVEPRLCPQMVCRPQSKIGPRLASVDAQPHLIETEVQGGGELEGENDKRNAEIDTRKQGHGQGITMRSQRATRTMDSSTKGAKLCGG